MRCKLSWDVFWERRKSINHFNPGIPFFGRSLSVKTKIYVANKLDNSESTSSHLMHRYFYRYTEFNAGRHRAWNVFLRRKRLNFCAPVKKCTMFVQNSWNPSVRMHKEGKPKQLKTDSPTLGFQIKRLLFASMQWTNSCSSPKSCLSHLTLATSY